MTTKTALAAAEAGFDTSLNRLMNLLRIPSISTDPAHHKDCATALYFGAAPCTFYQLDFQVPSVVPPKLTNCLWRRYKLGV